MQIEPTYTFYIDTFDLILSDNGLTNVIKNINIIIVASVAGGGHRLRVEKSLMCVLAF